MSETKPFDPYHELLGIAPPEQPPNLYRLLGVTAFESNPSVIERAADRQMAHLRSFRIGKHSADSQRLLNEISQARLLLLDDAQRSAYDNKLREQLNPGKPVSPQPLKVARALPQPQPVPVAAPVAPWPTPASAAPVVVKSTQPRKQSKGALIGMLAVAFIAVAAGVVVVVLGSRTPPQSITQNPNPPAPTPEKPVPAENIVPKVGPPKVPVTTPAEAQKSPVPAVVSPLPKVDPPPAAPPAPIQPEPPPATPEVAPPSSVAPATATAIAEPDLSKELAEVAAAREALASHPKFKKYYDHLRANPETLPTNGPKLAAMLMAEAQVNAAIREHPPSQLAALREVERLATAGLDYQQAIASIELQAKHSLPLLSTAQARTAKGNLLASAAEAANTARAKPPEREALLTAIRALLPEAISEQDDATLGALLAADAKLGWTAADRTASLQSSLPLAEKTVGAEQIEASRLLLDHLDALVAKQPVGKPRKDVADAIAGLRKRFSVVTATAAAKAMLATNPTDAAANQTIALYLLTRGQWRDSLPHWERASDPDVRSLATDTIKAQVASEKTSLADRWATVKLEDGAPGKEIARQLFHEALADTTLVGIARAAAEEKFKALGPSQAAVAESPATVPRSSPAGNARSVPLNKPLSLLPLVDLGQDSVHGNWSKGPKGSIQVTEPKVHSRLRLPIDLTNCDYDLTAEFKLGDKAHSVHLILPVGERSVQLVVDGYDLPASYFDLVGGQEARYHKNAVFKQLLFPNRAYRYDISVRCKGDQAHLVFSLNGAKQFEYAGPVADLQVRPVTEIGTTAQPALAVSNNVAEFTSCQVKPLSGEPKLVRENSR